LGGEKNIGKRGNPREEGEEAVEKLRIPRKGELFGVVEQRLGGNHIRVNCEDGHTRICRIPGKIWKRVWLREGDVIIVKPWPVQSDIKADVVWRYTKTQVEWLKRKGHLKL